MTRTLSQEELASETGVSLERIHWMARIAILKPVEPGRFRLGDVFRVKLVAALLDAGFTRDQIEWGAAEGGFNLDHVDNFLLVDPGPRSERTFSEFLSTAGPRSSLLPAVYEVLGLPQPDPSSPIHVHEEELLERSSRDGDLLPAMRPSSGRRD